MHKRLRRFGAAMGMSVTVLFAASGTFAQTVYCMNCSSEITQLLNLARLIDQLGTQNQQLQNMIDNRKPFASLQWGNGASNLQSVNSLLSGSGALSFANSGVASQFNQQYGTYDSYRGAQATSASADAKYEEWSANRNASVLSTLQAGNMQSSQMTGEEQSDLAGLKSQIGGMTSEIQGLQALGQIGIYNIQELQALRQLVLMDMSMRANAMAIEGARADWQQANWRNFVGSPGSAGAGGGQKF